MTRKKRAAIPMAVSRRRRGRTAPFLFSPSPGTPGEGWGEGSVPFDPTGFKSEGALTPTLSRSTGRGSEGRISIWLRSIREPPLRREQPGGPPLQKPYDQPQHD